MAHAHAPGREPGRGLLAVLFGAHWRSHAQAHALDAHRVSVLRDLGACRTAALGGHLHACHDCESEVPLYNSCRNRHCPTCQGPRQAAWVEARQAKMLPVEHFHVVFTLPEALRPVAKSAPGATYDLLMKAAAETLQLLAHNELDAQLAITAILHTWTRELLLHPHVHC